MRDYLAALLVVALAVSGAFAPGVAFGSEAYIVDLERGPDRDGHLTLSARLIGAFKPKIEDSLSAGAPLTFTYHLRLARSRALIWDKKSARLIARKMLKYDTLRKKYFGWIKTGSSLKELDFSRSLESLKAEELTPSPRRGGSEASAETDRPGRIVSPMVFDDRVSARGWISSLDSIKIYPRAQLDPEKIYYYMARCEISVIRLVFPFNYILFFVKIFNFETGWARSSPFMASSTG